MKKRIFIALTVLIPSFIAIMGILHYFLLNNRPGTPGPLPPLGRQELRVASMNLNWLNFNRSASYSAARLASCVRENDIDIILLQEYRPHWQFNEYDFASLFCEDYGYVTILEECVCISRYPVTSHKRIKYDDFSDSFSDITITLPDSTDVRIFSVHLMTTGLNGFRNGRPDKASLSFWDAAYTYSGNRDIRKNQGKSLARRAKEAEGSPLIVAGDFNCIPGASPYLQMIKVPLKDSFLSAGRGKGATYRNMRDVARIDYIFYNNEFECTDCRIVDDGISDHRMVVSTFRTVQKKEGK